ncbi:Cytochrome c-type biogenesis protein CcmH/NrfF [Micromonospora echinospora]|uniref:Cytochrome c-type biogenesis protein n=1 Tax=Micromonospora echinospora TaxID=1877 RepID=A0A1C4YXF2_MICEC|nr:cytochrome c-type biogenesis protein CcmH [Micromonospora echinospora]SCF25380.1 Cytochrome c-type biogenesis protein CcmH/NrfF [Micromonospora echinospora]
MTRRRLVVALGLGVLLALAVGGLVRSTGAADGADPVADIAAGLRCPSCQGESVADSRSPVAASMRQVVADQVARGRSPEEIRQWFVARYGEEVLAQPRLRGLALLLWVVPAVTLLGAGAAAARTLRPRAPDGERRRPDGGSARIHRRRPRRTLWLTAAGLVAVVATVAVAADQLVPPAPPTPVADPTAVTLRLAQDLESQQRYDAAAQMYREALRDRPDDDLRLRLAFALLRSSDAAGAEDAARQVLAHAPDLPDGLLVLGLAQRTTRPADAPATLRRFLAVAPEHPATAEIRRLVESRPRSATTPGPAQQEPE